MSHYRDLNAEINLWGEDGNLQLEKDKEAAREFFIGEDGVNANTWFFHDLEEKTNYLIKNGYWRSDVALKYGHDALKSLMKHAYGKKFRFKTLMGAEKFYRQYAMKDTTGKHFLERYEDRVVMVALAFSDNLDHAFDIVDEIISGRFQPATPTFLNAGRVRAGAPVSCFLLRIEDNMESIARGITDSLQLSKRGGGVALLLSNIRESGAPIKEMENQSSGIIPVMKMLEDAFSYANQLGARQGAGAVYLNAHHPDIMSFLDTKRENADEKIRIKTLSLGVVIPDITFELAKKNEDMYLFSPYDVERVYGKPFADISVTEEYKNMVENPDIRKTKIRARKFFQTLAEVQFESGYPYIMFEDTANRANPAPNIGRITMSNLCSEILQPQVGSKFNENGFYDEVGRDISCNLGSMNVAKMAELDNREEFAHSVDVAYRFLTNVAEDAELDSVPSVDRGNRGSRAIGLGQMNLHGFFIEQGIDYDSDEAREFWRSYMSDITYSIISASLRKAQDEGDTFEGFEGSRWQSGEQIQDIIDFGVSSRFDISEEEWKVLKTKVGIDGLYNRNLQAIPPTGSISYINNATASIHPVTSKVEIRKEGKTGRIYYPAYGMTNENHHTIKTAYEYGPNAVIDMYAVSAPFVDQGQSMTLFFRDTATTRDINKAQIRAWNSGVKSIYYIRLLQEALAGTEVEGCVSCAL